MKKITAQTGFSLVELILVIAISVMILTVLTNITPALSLIKSSSHESTAQQITAKRIETIRAQGYDSLANGVSAISDSRLSSLPQGAASTTIADCPNTICLTNEPVKYVTIQVVWVQNNKSVSYSISTLVSKGGLR